MKVVICGMLFLFSFQSFAFQEYFRTKPPRYLHLAWGEYNSRTEYPRKNWPFSLKSIGHTMASYQYYGGPLSSAYFHHGLDIRGDAGTPVFAAAGGRVVNIENYKKGNDLYWEIAILDDQGFLWQYHHVDRRSIPQKVWDAYQKKQTLAEGEKIGEIVKWPVTSFGERFNHVHLNVLDKKGRYLNPFHFLKKLDDQQAPVIKQIGLLQNGKQLQGNSVSGNYSLYLEATDLILHDKFVVPPHLVTVAIDGREEQTFWKFNDLPGKSDRKKFVNNFYVPKATVGNYNSRRIVMNLGFGLKSKISFPQTSGEHSVLITVQDYLGNEDQKTFTWQVK